MRCEKNDFVQTRYLFVFNSQQGDAGAVNFQTLLVRSLSAFLLPNSSQQKMPKHNLVSNNMVPIRRDKPATPGKGDDSDSSSSEEGSGEGL